MPPTWYRRGSTATEVPVLNRHLEHGLFPGRFTHDIMSNDLEASSRQAGDAVAGVLH
jgi:hypothetical protein